VDVLIRKQVINIQGDVEPIDNNPIRQGHGAWAYFTVLKAVYDYLHWQFWAI